LRKRRWSLLRFRQGIARLSRNWPVKILSLAAAILLVLFNNLSRLEDRYLSVPLDLVLHEGFVPSAPYPERVRVRIRGEADQIFRLIEDDLYTYLDLSEHRSSGEYRGAVEVEKRGTALVMDAIDISVDPAVITVRLEEKMTRSVEISPSLAGYPPPGYQLAQYQVTPSIVDIEGPRSVVQKYETLSTENIDISDKQEDFEVRVRIEKPDPMIRIPAGEVVEFRGVIEEAVVLTTFEPVEIVILNLEPGLVPASGVPRGSIRVQGFQAQIDAVAGRDVQLVMDASSVDGPGRYTLSVRPAIPGGLLVLRYEPQSLEIEFERTP
jgi:YbbR domain-containing protein